MKRELENERERGEEESAPDLLAPRNPRRLIDAVFHAKGRIIIAVSGSSPAARMLVSGASGEPVLPPFTSIVARRDENTKRGVFRAVADSNGAAISLQNERYAPSFSEIAHRVVRIKCVRRTRLIEFTTLPAETKIPWDLCDLHFEGIIFDFSLGFVEIKICAFSRAL